MPDQITLQLGLSTQGALSQLEREINAIERKRRSLNFQFNDNSLKSSLRNLNEFDNVLRRVGSHVTAFGASFVILDTVKRSVEEAAKSFIDLDQTLTRVNLNFRTTQANINQFGNALFQIARNTGQAYQAVAKVAEEFSQQGLSLNETLKRTEAALILVRRSSISTEDAIESITSAITEYKTESLSAIDIADKFVSVNGKFSTTSQKIAEGFLRVGSTAKEAGLNLNQVIAYLTTITSITQRSGDVAGTGLNQFLTRLRSPATVAAFQQRGGIQLESSPGKYLPTQQAIENVAKAYEKAQGEEKQWILTTVAGSRQLNVISALLDDVTKKTSIYGQALQAVGNSSNAAMQQNEQQNKSFLAQINSAEQSLTQIAAVIGKLTLQPLFGRTVGNFNDIAKTILNNNNPNSFVGFGEKLGKGILQGIGNALAGPGLVIGGAVLYKLVGQVGKYVAGGIADLLKTNSATEKQEALQVAIGAALKQQGISYRDLLSLGNTREKQEQAILDIIKQQGAARIGGSSVISNVASTIYQQGGRVSHDQIKFSASGYMPEEIQSAVANERAATSAGVGGASGANPVVVDNFSIGGQKQTIIANDKEFFVPTRSLNPSYNGPDQVSIVNPSMVSSMGGLPQGAIPVRAKGFVPRAALGNIPYDFSSYGTSAISSILPYILGGASALGLGGIGINAISRLFSGKEGEVTGGTSGGSFYDDVRSNQIDYLNKQSSNRGRRELSAIRRLDGNLIGDKSLSRRTKRGLVQLGTSFGYDRDYLKGLTKAEIGNLVNSKVLEGNQDALRGLLKRGYEAPYQRRDLFTSGNISLNDTSGNFYGTYGSGAAERNFGLLRKVGIHASGFSPNYALGTGDLFKQGRSILRKAKNYNTYDDAVSALPQFKKDLKEYLHSRNPSQISTAHRLIEKLKKAGFGIEYDKDLFPTYNAKDLVSEGNNLLGYTNNYKDYGNAKKVFPYFASNLQNYINSKKPNRRDATSIYNLASRLRKAGFGVDYSGGTLEDIIGDFSSGVGINVNTVRGTKKQQNYQQKLASYMKLGMNERQAADRIVDDQTDKSLNSYQNGQRQNTMQQYLDEFPDFARGYVPHFAGGFDNVTFADNSDYYKNYPAGVQQKTSKFGQVIGEGFQSTVYDAGKYVFKARKNARKGENVNRGQNATRRGLQFLGGLINSDSILKSTSIQVALPSSPPKAIQSLFSDQQGFFQPNLAGLRHANGDESFMVRQQVAAAIARRGATSKKGFSSFTIGDLRNDNILIDGNNKPIVVDLLTNKSESYRKLLRSKSNFAGGYVPISDLRRSNGRYSEQGFSGSRVAEIIENVTGFKQTSSLKNLIENVRNSPEALEKLKHFIANNPIKLGYNPDGAYVADGNHRTFIADQIGLSHIPHFAGSYVPSPILSTEAQKIPALNISQYQSDNELRQGILDYYHLFKKPAPVSVANFGQGSGLDEGKVSAVRRSFNISGLNLLRSDNQQGLPIITPKGNIGPAILSQVQNQLGNANQSFRANLNNTQIEDLAKKIITDNLLAFDKETKKQLGEVRLSRTQIQQKVQQLNSRAQGDPIAAAINRAVTAGTNLTSEQENYIVRSARGEALSGLSARQRKDPKTREAVDVFATAQLDIVKGNISNTINQRTSNRENADFTNNYISRYGGFRGTLLRSGTNNKEIEDFVQRQVSLGADEDEIRNRVGGLQGEARQRSLSSRSQIGLGAVFAAPVVAGAVGNYFGPRGSAVVSGITDSLSTGGAIAAAGGFNPVALSIGGVVTALGLFKTALDTTGPSFERAQQEFQNAQGKVQDRAKGLQDYIDTVSHVQEVISQGGTPEEVARAKAYRNISFHGLDSDIQKSVTGKSIDQLNEFSAQNQFNDSKNILQPANLQAVFSDVYKSTGLFRSNPFRGDEGVSRLKNVIDILTANKITSKDFTSTSGFGRGVKGQNISSAVRQALGSNSETILNLPPQAFNQIRDSLLDQQDRDQNFQSANNRQDGLAGIELLPVDVRNRIQRSIYNKNYSAQSSFNTQSNNIARFTGGVDTNRDTYTNQLLQNVKFDSESSNINNQNKLETTQAISEGLDQIKSVFSDNEGKTPLNEDSADFARKIISAINSGTVYDSKSGLATLQKLEQQLPAGSGEIQEKIKEILESSFEKLGDINQKTQQGLAINEIQRDIAQKQLDVTVKSNFAGGIGTFTNPSSFSDISNPINSGLTSLINRGSYNLPGAFANRLSNATTSQAIITQQQQGNLLAANSGRSNLALAQSFYSLAGNDSGLVTDINNFVGGAGRLSKDITSQRKLQLGGLASSALGSLSGLIGGYEVTPNRLQREAAQGANSLNFSGVVGDLQGLRANSNVLGNQNILDKLIDTFNLLNKLADNVGVSSDQQAGEGLKSNKLSPEDQRNKDATSSGKTNIIDVTNKLIDSNVALNTTLKNVIQNAKDSKIGVNAEVKVAVNVAGQLQKSINNAGLGDIIKQYIIDNVKSQALKASPPRAGTAALTT